MVGDPFSGKGFQDEKTSGRDEPVWLDLRDLHRHRIVWIIDRQHES
jgi:hypothetical protein